MKKKNNKPLSPLEIINLNNNEVYQQSEGIVVPRIYKTKSRGKYSGTREQQIYNMLYLMYKYPSDCVIVSLDKVYTSMINWKTHDKGPVYRGGLVIPAIFWEKLRNCGTKYRYTIFLLNIYCLTMKLAHANIMIYDSRDKSLERFEPHGVFKNKCFNSRHIDIDIITEIRKHMGNSFVKRMYNMSALFPGIQQLEESSRSFEDMEEDGYCSAWITWYAELRMSNPDLSAGEILKYATNSAIGPGNQSYHAFIKNYSAYMLKIREKIKKEKGKGNIVVDLADKYFSL